MIRKLISITVFSTALALALGGVAFAAEVEVSALDPVTEESAEGAAEAPDVTVPDIIAPDEGEEGADILGTPQDPAPSGEEVAASVPVPAPVEAPIHAPVAAAPAPAVPAAAAPVQQPAAASAVADGWNVQDGKTYYYQGGKRTTGWVVTDVAPDGERGLQRYWLSSDGSLATGLIDAGSDWFAYGISGKGYVVRGIYRDPITGWFYFADNDGRLLAPGWHVTDGFGQELQRYYIDPRAHAAVPGVSHDGWKHFTRGDAGYVARGKVDCGDGTSFLADNDGRLLPAGWAVTDIFGQGLQRYYVSNLGKSTVGHFRVNGVAYYGRPDLAYVLRGKAVVSGNGYTQMALADNDGRLADFEGWLVTDIYDGHLERYRLDSSVAPGFYGAHLGLFTLGDQDFYGREDQGYLVRGNYRASNGRLYHGDNDGVLGIPKVSGNEELDYILFDIISRKGTDLGTLFNYVAFEYSYISGSKYPSGNWSIPFAIEMYNNGGGNCYRFASLFAWLAEAVGYQSRAVAGELLYRNGTTGAHGWVELYIDGATYVCDPQLQNRMPYRNFYMITYGNAPITYI